ncbi:MAG: hypothetical protein DHS20C12_06150 [Pseudohongiella sp.]|nr:MAG: hypothetical protein DHS20C12_06150 [Pseudohongiella sp.]
MPENDIKVALARHDSYLERVAEMLSYANTERDIPKHLLLDEKELESIDNFLDSLAARLLKNPQPSEDEWLAPVRFAYRTGYGKNGPNGWLEALYRGLKQSRAFFEAFESSKPKEGIVTNYNITIKDVVGPVNVLSTLDNVVQSVNNAPSLPSESKETLAALFEELKSVLSSAPADLNEGAELISEQAEVLSAELERPEPRSSALKIKSSGLVEAAKAIEAIVPAAISVAKRIAEFVTNPIA